MKKTTILVDERSIIAFLLDYLLEPIEFSNIRPTSAVDGIDYLRDTIHVKQKDLICGDVINFHYKDRTRAGLDIDVNVNYEILPYDSLAFKLKRIIVKTIALNEKGVPYDLVPELELVNSASSTKTERQAMKPTPPMEKATPRPDDDDLPF